MMAHRTGPARLNGAVSAHPDGDRFGVDREPVLRVFAQARVVTGNVELHAPNIQTNISLPAPQLDRIDRSAMRAVCRGSDGERGDAPHDGLSDGNRSIGHRQTQPVADLNL